MSNYNLLVYKYGGNQPVENHLKSIAKGKIARTGKKGKLPKNKNIGDHILVISQASDNSFICTYGKYSGIDHTAEDIWNDASSTYDRTTVEHFVPVVTKSFTKEEFLRDAIIGQGTYNDNGKNASKWLSLMLAA